MGNVVNFGELFDLREETHEIPAEAPLTRDQAGDPTNTRVGNRQQWRLTGQNGRPTPDMQASVANLEDLLQSPNFRLPDFCGEDRHNISLEVVRGMAISMVLWTVRDNPAKGQPRAQWDENAVHSILQRLIYGNEDGSDRWEPAEMEAVSPMMPHFKTPNYAVAAHAVWSHAN